MLFKETRGTNVSGLGKSACRDVCNSSSVVVSMLLHSCSRPTKPQTSHTCVRRLVRVTWRRACCTGVRGHLTSGPLHRQGKAYQRLSPCTLPAHPTIYRCKHFHPPHHLHSRSRLPEALPPVLWLARSFRSGADVLATHITFQHHGEITACDRTSPTQQNPMYLPQIVSHPIHRLHDTISTNLGHHSFPLVYPHVQHTIRTLLSLFRSMLPTKAL